MKFNIFEIHLVEHCNLKCQSCDNFSSLAEEEFVKVEDFCQEMKQMSLIAGHQIQRIRLLGGEPLLHPNLNELLINTRIYFPNTAILLTTNAILLDKMSEEFWNVCHDNGIIIEYTWYPINIDRNKHLELAKKYDVSLIPFDGVPTNSKVSHRNPINDKGDQDKYFNYEHCYQRWRCMSLKDGKLYPCTCIPNVYHFNKYFNKNIPVTDKDYIDIFKVQNVKEIEEFLNHEVPFCSYCNVRNRTNGKPWAVTKFELEEWFDA
jgi:MoaA/NifB/PqqE/SkfB family radical SAM enzyme